MPRRSPSVSWAGSWAGVRLGALPLALPVGRLTVAVAAGLVAVSCLAGVLRLLPVLLSPGAPLGLAPLLARGIAGVALETALFVAPPVAWALGCARLVDRGEARALLALGVRPARLLGGTWPAALAVAAASALAAISWGTEAAAPGRLVRDLVAAARADCEERTSARETGAGPTAPAAAEVPLLGVSWVCFPGAPPRAVGAPGGTGPGPAFAAASLDVSDDLRTLAATDLTVAFPGASPGAPPLLLRAARATVRGLVPSGRASNLRPLLRVAVLTGSALANALLASALVLLGSPRSRTAALVLGASGPAAALLVFSALERGPVPLGAYAAVPAAGLAAVGLAAALARGQRRVGRASRALATLPGPGEGGTASQGKTGGPRGDFDG